MLETNTHSSGRRRRSRPTAPPNTIAIMAAPATGNGQLALPTTDSTTTTATTIVDMRARISRSCMSRKRSRSPAAGHSHDASRSHSPGSRPGPAALEAIPLVLRRLSPRTTSPFPFTRAGTGSSEILHAERAGGALAVGRDGLAVQAGRDAVVDRVVAGPHGGQPPLDLARLAGDHGPERPRVRVRGRRRPRGRGRRSTPAGCGRPVAGRRSRARTRSRPRRRGRLGLDRHREVRQVAVVGVADRDPHASSAGRCVWRAGNDASTTSSVNSPSGSSASWRSLRRSAATGKARARIGRRGPHGARERTTGFRG